MSEVNLNVILRGRLKPVLLGEPTDNGEATYSVRPVSDAMQEAILQCVLDAQAELGLSDEEIGVETPESGIENAESEGKRVAAVVARLKFKKRVAYTRFMNSLENTRILHSVVFTKTGERAFETMQHVREIPQEVKAKFLEVIEAQKDESAGLGESKPGA